MSAAYQTTESSVSAQETNSKWAINTMAPRRLFGTEAFTDPELVDEVVHRLLDEIVYGWPYAKQAKTLLYRARMAGKVSKATRGRYDVLLPPPVNIRRKKTPEQKAAARTRHQKNLKARAAESERLAKIRAGGKD